MDRTERILMWVLVVVLAVSALVTAASAFYLDHERRIDAIEDYINARQEAGLK